MSAYNVECVPFSLVGLSTSPLPDVCAQRFSSRDIHLEKD